MALNIRKDGGFQIENELFFAYTYAHNALINLALEQGEQMRYQQNPMIVVDFPGEYDINGWTIKAILGKNQKLNYLIQGKNKKIGLISSADVLELDEVAGMDYWLYIGEGIQKKFDQLEMEGELINLETRGQTQTEE